MKIRNIPTITTLEVLRALFLYFTLYDMVEGLFSVSQCCTSCLHLAAQPFGSFTGLPYGDEMCLVMAYLDYGVMNSFIHSFIHISGTEFDEGDLYSRKGSAQRSAMSNDIYPR